MPAPDITPVPKDSSQTSPRRSHESTPLSPFLRILLALAGCGLIAGFTLAAWLEPSPAGYGTHQQLGLPPCSIQFLFGIPCPSCGMTTSFSWFVRGHLIESIQTNVAATFLAMTCVVLIPALFLSSAGKISWNRRTLEKQAIVLLSVFILLALIQWTVRFVGAS